MDSAARVRDSSSEGSASTRCTAQNYRTHQRFTAPAFAGARNHIARLVAEYLLGAGDRHLCRRCTWP